VQAAELERAVDDLHEGVRITGTAERTPAPKEPPPPRRDVQAADRWVDMKTYMWCRGYVGSGGTLGVSEPEGPIRTSTRTVRGTGSWAPM
jgi:hypothetical protein